MAKSNESYSPSGVRIADDFRDNLIIDRYHQCFVSMRQSKKKHLKSENSEDVISWNVFRSLRQISPDKWAQPLFQGVFGSMVPGTINDTTIQLWRDVPPPPALLQTGDEGISEIDIVVENPSWVWFIEAKYKSDISEGTTTRANRDQILRNIDVGTFYAGVRPFYFALLILDKNRSPKGVAALERYRSHAELNSCLPHRSDGLSNLKGVGLITWSYMAHVLSKTSKEAITESESVIAEKAVRWLRSKGIKPDDISNIM